MAYLLIDDGMADNPKLTGLSDRAFRLWITSLVYCARNLTDGAISELALSTTAANSKIARPKHVVDELVAAGLWELTDSGWVIHDYLEYNPSRAELSQKRALERERKRRHRNKGHASLSRVTGRGSHAYKDPQSGSTNVDPHEASNAKASPREKTSNKETDRDAALAEAFDVAAGWDGPQDTIAFEDAIDQVARKHHTRIPALDRDRLWDIAFGNHQQ